MSTTIFIVGLDGSESGARALAFAKDRARAVGDCRIIICYVIEWSPFAFQTAEENAKRHQRREAEIAMAQERVLDPSLTMTRAEGFDIEAVVRHGDAAEILDSLAREKNAKQIIIGRVGARGLKARIFGGVAGRLAAASSVPVTIIP
ncbi:MAG: universal stress protein [Loktanella sp.]|nr:universal stress protein [Loktanella sp.]